MPDDDLAQQHREAFQRYLRTGECEDLECLEKRLCPGAVRSSGYRVPEMLEREIANRLFKTAAKRKEIYAMPVATYELLNDTAVNIEAWLADEVARPFADQAPFLVIASHDTGIRVLRDPYSCKPYVLFYVTMPALVPACEAPTP